LTSSSRLWQKPADKDSFKERSGFDLSGLWQKLTNKEPLKEVSDFDLFYQLTYMSAVASAGISRARIFSLGSRLPRPPAEYFARVHLLAQKLGYDYAAACTMVGEGVKSEQMKSLLLRFSGALNAGQGEGDFLTEEALVQGEAYEKEYERDVAALTKWTDAYAAIVVSAVLIIIINLTSTLIYNLGTSMIMGLVITAVLTASLGAWILSRAAPREVRILYSLEGTGTQRLARRLGRYIPAATLTVCLLLALLGLRLGQILIVAAIILLPLGLVSMLAGRDIAKKDQRNRTFPSLPGVEDDVNRDNGNASSRRNRSQLFPHVKAGPGEASLEIGSFH